MKRWHQRDTLHLSLSGPALSPWRDGSDTGEVEEALVNNSKPIRRSLEESSPAVPQLCSFTLSVYGGRGPDTLNSLLI